MQTVICAKKDTELIHFLCFFECLSMQCSYRLNSSYKGGHIMLHIFGSMVKKRMIFVQRMSAALWSMCLVFKLSGPMA